MYHPKGLIPTVIVIVMAVIVLTLVGATQLYYENREIAITQTEPHGCEAINNFDSCRARTDCTPILEDQCTCNEAALRQEKCGNSSAEYCLCGFHFVSCETLSCQNVATSFDECVAQGNPVMESYPRRCTADGYTFTEESIEDTITPELQ